MATIKSYTDIEQSKVLAKILPIESSDMTHHWFGKALNVDCYEVSYGRDTINGKDIPCWSLTALINTLPKIHKLKPILDLEYNSILYSGTNLNVRADNIIDACYAMILKLKGQNLL